MSNKQAEIQKLREQGNISFQKRNFTAAIECYQKGLELDEAEPHLNSNLAQAYLESNQFKLAEFHAKIAINNNKNSAKGYFRAAKACVGLGQTSKAISFLKEGIENCTETGDLKSLLQSLSEDEQGSWKLIEKLSFTDIHVSTECLPDGITMDVPPLISDSDSDDDSYNVKRSRSTSRMDAGTTNLDSQKNQSGTQRSLSMSRNSKSSMDNKTNKKSNKKKKQKPNDNDPFLLTLETIKKEIGIESVTPEQFWINKRKELQALMKEGSDIMGSGLLRKAVEKYKAAFDIVVENPIEMLKVDLIDVIVLKFALCIGWIELANYRDIAKAVQYLTEIEETRASKFPAVFYGLGNAYYKLNRYKAATEHLEKGLLFLKREVKFDVQSWPGTNNVIQETTRSGLEEVLKELLKTCRAYHEPDAICRYSKCLTLSSHIIPSEHIFYSDPDFSGLVVIFCEEKCRIEYHPGCWKDYKETATKNNIGKLPDKDFIGKECPTTDCWNQENERSVITKIEIIGDDTTVKTCIEAPKNENIIKETKKNKKKKNEKVTETVLQDKPKVKQQPKIKKNIVPTTTQDMSLSSSINALTCRLEKLRLLREINFGYTDDNDWNPRKEFYGCEDMRNLDTFLSSKNSKEPEGVRVKMDFIFSYFYEFIRNEGPQKHKDVERKWQNEADDFEGVKEFMNDYSNICSFLLQSLRFVSNDDYICLAEQLPATYIMAKTEMVESMSFTMTGIFAKSSNSNTDTKGITNITLNDNFSIGAVPASEAPLKLLFSAISKTSDDSGSSPTDGENAVKESTNSEREKLDSYSTANDDDGLEDDDSDNNEYISDSDSEDEMSDEEENDNADNNDGKDDNKIETTKEKVEVNEKEDKDKEQVENVRESSPNQKLSSSAVEFKPPADVLHNILDSDMPTETSTPHINAPPLEGITFPKEWSLESIQSFSSPKKWSLEDGLENVSPNKSLDDVSSNTWSLEDGQQNTSLNKSLEDISPTKWSLEDGELHTSYEEISPNKWSLEDGQWRLQDGQMHVISEWSAEDSQLENNVVQLIDVSTSSTTIEIPPVKEIKVRSDISIQTDDTRHLEEELTNLESTVKKVEKELESEREKLVTAKRTSDSKIEQQDNKIKELELKISKIMEENSKGIKNLEEKLKKKEAECEIQKEKFLKEAEERTLQEKNTTTMMRDLISKTGRNVKELQENLCSVRKDIIQYQQLVIKVREEGAEFWFSSSKRRSTEILQALRSKLKYLTDTTVPNKNEVVAAIKDWEKYQTHLVEQKALYKVQATSLSEKVKNTVVSEKDRNLPMSEINKLLWPEIPKEPNCLINALEDMTQRVFDENKEVKDRLEEQNLKLKEKDQEVAKLVAEKLQNMQNISELKKAIDSRTEKLLKAIEEDTQKSETSKPSIKQDEKTDEPVKTEKNVEQKKEQSSNAKESVREVSASPNGQMTNMNGFYRPVMPMNPSVGIPLYQHGQPYHYQMGSPYVYPSSSSYHPLQMPVPYGQHQGHSVILPPKRPPGPSAFKSNEKPVFQIKEHKTTPSSTPVEELKSLIATSSPPDASKPTAAAMPKPDRTSSEAAVAEKKKVPTLALTPIELTKPVPTSTTASTSTMQMKALSSFTTVTNPKKTNHIPKLHEAPKSSLPFSFGVPSLPTGEPKTIPGAGNGAAAASIAVSRPKKESSLQKLIVQLLKHFPSKTEEELRLAVATVREKNNNSLTGLTQTTIMGMVDRVLKEKPNKKQGSMGLDKFGGGSAWGGVRESETKWSKPKESFEDECSICMDPMNKNRTSLHCKHTFHTECIRKWLRTESICPICRVFTKMDDEFPALS